MYSKSNINNVLKIFTDYRHDIDRVIKKLIYLAEEDLEKKHLINTINDIVFTDKNRDRGIFCILISDLLGMPKKRAVILSAIIELLYHSTLFYDNIIKFKNHNHEMSIMKFIASSSLINLAFEAISSDILKISDSNKNTIVQILSKYTGRDGLFGGYFLELECNYNKKLSKHQLTRIHKLKISSLFLATVACITALNDTNSKEIIALNSYANNLGLIISMSTNHRHNNDAQVNLLASQAVDILKIFPPSDKILLLESFINYHKDKCIKNKSSM